MIPMLYTAEDVAFPAPTTEFGKRVLAAAVRHGLMLEVIGNPGAHILGRVTFGELTAFAQEMQRTPAAAEQPDSVHVGGDEASPVGVMRSGVPESLSVWANTYRLADVSNDWDAGYETARAYVKVQLDSSAPPEHGATSDDRQEAPAK